MDLLYFIICFNENKYDFFNENKYAVPRVLPQGGPKFEKVHFFEKIQNFDSQSPPGGNFGPKFSQNSII